MFRRSLVTNIAQALLLLLVLGSLAFAQKPKKDKENKNHVPTGCAEGQVAKWEDADGDPLTPEGVWVCAEDIGTADITALDGRVTDLEDANPNPDPPCFDNDNRYVECTDADGFSNGTVTDTVTGLIWLQDANCFGALTYADANERAAQLGADTVDDCGLNDNSKPGDWRLPTKAEWDATIAQAVAFGCIASDAPSLTSAFGQPLNAEQTGCFATEPVHAFSGVQSNEYWSSSAIAPLPERAWFVDLVTGATINGGRRTIKVEPRFVWPVRGGQ